MRAKRGTSPWDLTALLNAADPKASLAERHLWIIRFLEWLRHAPVQSEARASAPAGLVATSAPEPTPTPALRLRHMLGVIERNAEHRDRVGAMLVAFLREVDSAALLADFGFAPRAGLWAEFGRRVRSRILPLTPATSDLGELFALLFPPGSNVAWLTELDPETEARLAALLAPIADDGSDWRAPFFEAIMFLASAIRSAGFSPLLRQRMSPELLVDEPFRQLARAAELIREHAESSEPEAHAQLLRDAQYLRALLDVCRRCAASVHEHLEAHGVSVDVVFEADQLRERTHRIELLLGCVLSERPARELLRFVAQMVDAAESRRSIRSLFAEHYSILARKVAERSADAGDHYITRDAAEYREMLRAAAGGGAVLGATTLLKALMGMIGLGVFWGGLANGLNYAASFVLIQLLHFTVATKQPAMTAPALADKLGDVASDEGLERFVDEVACLIRSQAAGIFGNLLAVVPVVLGAQWLARAAFGAPIVGPAQAEYTLASLSLAGPTPIFAALTGVLLFASSLIAGWVENWFVWHRLDSAIAWNPRIVDRFGAARARWWSAFWRRNISGLGSNVSLGLLLGLVPAIASFFSVPIDVRHVTLATGQLAAAVGMLGVAIVASAPFWWCVAGIAAIGALNLGVSFWLAFRVALRSRGIHLADRSRIHRAIRSRLRQRPASFILPPRLAPAQPSHTHRGRRMPLWTILFPLLSIGLVGLGFVLPVGALLIAAAVPALCGSVLASVHHAEVVAHRVGEPFGTLILALAVTVIELALIVSMMLAGGPDKSALARDTIFSAIMIICNGAVGLCLVVGGLKYREPAFSVEGTSVSLSTLIALATLCLVLPSFTTSNPGPSYTAPQLAFAAIASLVLWGGFVFVQTVRHRDYFLPPVGGDDESAHAAPPSTKVAWASFGLLVVSLVAVIGLAKVLSPAVESGVAAVGAPPAVIGIVIALLVLLPETWAAARAAATNRLQTSLNLALGSALASIGLTIPAVALVATLLGMPLQLGLTPKDLVLLALTFAVSAITLVTGRTNVMEGVVHLVIFAAFVFLAFVP